MKGYKTLALNALSLAGVVLAWEPITTMVSPQHLLMAQAGVNILLRLVTDGPAPIMEKLRK